MNTNHTGKFTTLRAMYIPYLVSGDVMLTSLKSCRSPCTWHCHHAAERRQILSVQRCGRPIRQIWIRWTIASGGILQERVYRSQIHDVKELKEHLLSEWGLLDHIVITAAAIVQWCSCLNACVRVNGGHFEHKFWASDFLLYFVCFYDTGSPKCDRYKHVSSANIVWNVLLLCLRLSHGMVTT